MVVTRPIDADLGGLPSNESTWRANTRRRPNVDLMLGRRRRRWPSIKSALGRRLVFAFLTLPEIAR